MHTDLLSLADRRIEYRFAVPPHSSASDLVMLHEGLGSVSMWRDFPEKLARVTGLRTLVFSRHGYGDSSPLQRPRSIDFMHEEARVWLPAVLNALGIRRPVLFGHSDGASIALIHAAAPTSELAGLVILAPHVKVEDVTVESIERAKITYETTDMRVRLARHHADVDSAFWGWNQIWLDPDFRGWNIEPLLPSITCPVLAVQGRDDEYGTLEQVESIRRALPLTEVLELEECGHSPHRDQPVAVLKATRRFVARIGVARRFR
jgi:pimeloyl-ACP methyl ester carboxylesterase